MKDLNPISIITEGWNDISSSGDGYAILGHGVVVTIEGWGL